MLMLPEDGDYSSSSSVYEGTEKVSFVILNEMKDLLKVAIGGRFFALLRMTTTGKRTFSVPS